MCVFFLLVDIFFLEFKMANFFTVKVFDNLCDRDQTTEIIGFVDEISAPAEVGAKKKNRSYLNLF